MAGRLVDGKKIRDEIKHALLERVRGKFLRMDIIYIGEDAVIEKFVALKKKFGEDIGVSVVVHTLKESADISDIEAVISSVKDESSGIVIQLPLPTHLDRDEVLNLIPINLDIDVLSSGAFEKFKKGTHTIMPPVVAAIKEVFYHENVELAGENVVVVGKGRLVGLPVAVWLHNIGVRVWTIKKGDDMGILSEADIIISGAGSSHLIQPEMIKGGVVLIDAGTSDSEGGVKGDVDPRCGEKASLLSPVPGGIGPITIAKLFENLTIQGVTV